MSESRHISSMTASATASAIVAVLLVVVQFAAISWAPSALWVRMALPATIALAPLALWAHRRRLGTWVIAVGLAANLAAILANGGLMPIRHETVEAAIGTERAAAYAPGKWIPGSKDVLVAEGDGRLAALGDAVIIRTGHGGIAASAGDIVILAGLTILAGEAALTWASRARTAATAEDDQADSDVRLAA